jgi:hypothetical protein
MEPARHEHSHRVSDRATPSRTLSLPYLQLRLGALLAVGFATFLVGWLLLGQDHGSSAPKSGASASSETELRDFARTATNPIYWAGPRAGDTYELTRTADGRVYVRYLPEGVEVGDPRPQFLTVGTYRRPNAFTELQRAAKAPGASSRTLPKGGLAVFSKGSSSVYFGYPDGKYQVEVYAPSAGSARNLVLSGQVVPVR